MNTLNTMSYVCIISGCTNESYEADLNGNAELFNVLWNWKTYGMGIEFKQVTGYYDGNRETSYIVSFQKKELIEAFITLGAWLKQECILVREFMDNGLPVVNLIDTKEEEGKRTVVGHRLVKVGDARYMEVMPTACSIMGHEVWEVR